MVYMNLIRKKEDQERDKGRRLASFAPTVK
jgi:hypothetical protein